MDKARKRIRSNNKRIVKNKGTTLRNQRPKLSVKNDVGIRSSSASTHTQPTIGSMGWSHRTLNTVILPSCCTKRRFPQNLMDVVCEDCRHGVSLLHGSRNSNTAVNNTMDVDVHGMGSTNCADPVGLNVRPAGYTSGGESDVENASAIGLCGSPLCLKAEQVVVGKNPTIDAASSQGSVCQKDHSQEVVNPTSESPESEYLLPQEVAISLESNASISQEAKTAVSQDLQNSKSREELIISQQPQKALSEEAFNSEVKGSTSHEIQSSTLLEANSSESSNVQVPMSIYNEEPSEFDFYE
ncbi:uncharacterized protein LOC108134595 isoform X2 [Drosophila elegans]|nr:uncharacterized protein LOC108134595 isoform X2 [Drosophila elegans]